MRRGHPVFVIVLAFIAGLAGAVAGQALGQRRSAPDGTELHRLLHREFGLDTRQAAALDALERAYDGRRRILEDRMRTENVALARAIRTEHATGPRVIAAIDASHRTMGLLQQVTVSHVFAMRRLLRPDQAAHFDEVVTKVLIND